MKFNTKYIKKRIVLGFMVGLLSLTLTGCGNDLLYFSKTTLVEALDSRFDTNIRLIEGLYNAGLLTEKSYTYFTTAINGTRDNTIKWEDIEYKNESGETVTERIRTTDISFEISGTKLDKIKGSSHKTFSHIQVYDKDSLVAELTAGLEGDDKTNTENYLKELIEANGGIDTTLLGNCLNSNAAFKINGGAGTHSVPSNKLKPLTIVDKKEVVFNDIDVPIRVLKPDADLDKVMSY